MENMAVKLADRKVGHDPILDVIIPGNQQAVRAALAKEQGARERAQLAQAQFGIAFTPREVHERIRKVLPWRLSAKRSTHWYMVEGYGTTPSGAWGVMNNNSDLDAYPRLIPDAALARYNEAEKTKLFEAFYVIEPVYAERSRVQADPWLVGRIGLPERYIVLAYWD
jgi:hypothetical protein